MSRELRHPSAYGWRAKLGVIVPPTNTVNEAEWTRLVPEGVSFHTTRMPLHADTTSPEGTAALHRDLDRAMAMLTPAGLDVVAYACTAGSMVTPAGDLPAEMTHRSGTPCVSTSAAIVSALATLGVRKVAVATPYHEALNAHEGAFLAANGFDVTDLRGLGIGAGGPEDFIRIARTPLAEVQAHARRALGRNEEALLITCTDFPTLPCIPALEAECGLPVISSNTATLWQALRRAGIRDDLPAGGRLFQLDEERGHDR